MKKTVNKIFFVFLTILIVSAAQSCNKAPINGKLDGQWQIMSIETADGVMKPEGQYYYCFNLHIAQLNSVGHGVHTANMIYEGSEIHLDFPYSRDENSLKSLSAWGVDSNPVTLKVIRLTSSQLVMETATTVITCRRF